jgi:hypothetical protein
MRAATFGIVGRRYRRARSLRGSRRGVVAVVGTLLALLVFFALFGIFLTEYVPLWMTEDESAFSNQAETSFALLKSSVDAQYSLQGPPTYSTAFVMSSQAVPLIAAPTQGTISFLPATCPGNLSAVTGLPNQPNNCVFQRLLLSEGKTAPSQNHPFNVTSVSALFTMLLPNRYYTPVEYVFEDDGVFQLQPGGSQSVVVAPPLNITKVGSNVTVQTSFLELFGNSSSYTGQGSKSVYSHYGFSQFVTSVGRFVTAAHAAVPFNMTYEVGTRYVCGWYAFFDNLALSSGLTQYASGAPPAPPNPGYNLSASVALPPSGATCVNPLQTSADITITFYNINYATVSYAGEQLSFSQGGS